MVALNINGDKETTELLGELLSAKRRKQGEKKRDLELAQKRAEIQHINAQTHADAAKAQREIASVDLDSAQTELIRAQAMKTREEAFRLKLENLGLVFELVEKENKVFNSEQKAKIISKALLGDE